MNTNESLKNEVTNEVTNITTNALKEYLLNLIKNAQLCTFSYNH